MNTEKITIKDVAHICGVGISTVSRVLNNHPDVNEETKKRVLEVIKELNYIPNTSAQFLKRTFSDEVAIFINEFDPLFSLDIILKLKKCIENKDISAVVRYVPFEEDVINYLIAFEKERRIMATILLGNYGFRPEKVKQMLSPLILCGNNYFEKNNSSYYSYIHINEYDMGYISTKYLLNKGHSHIGLIYALNTYILSDILIGFREALSDRQLLIEPDFEISCSSKGCSGMGMVKKGYKDINKILKFHEIVAIITDSDSLALGCCRALLDNNRSIPRDISVLTIGGNKYASYYNPSLTSYQIFNNDIVQIIQNFFPHD